MAKRTRKSELVASAGEYDGLVGDISALLEQSRRTTARAINSILTATYWEVGRRIVEFEQGGAVRAEYGTELLKRLAADLTGRFGRGFSERNLRQMRLFHQGWAIWQTPSAEFQARVRLPVGLLESSGESFQTVSGTLARSPIVQTPSAEFDQRLFAAFPLAWSHYVRLMSVEKPHARAFYETEAVRGGWSVRQLDRQIATQFFERTASSKQQAAMLTRGRKPKPEDAVSAEDEIRDPYLLEFLNLKDEYSESDLEDALIEHLEAFLLELGAGFTFVARQKRIRIGTEWYWIDLLLFHRRLKCLVVIDLKLGKFTHADAGQMGLYLNYAKRHLTEPGENDPVGIILCSGKDDAVVEYAMGDMSARVFASKYLTQLPDAETLRTEIETTRRALIQRQRIDGSKKLK
jgi:predicted nuclease of restriction endonuclease-like (RecB) superfamily